MKGSALTAHSPVEIAQSRYQKRILADPAKTRLFGESALHHRRGIDNRPARIWFTLAIEQRFAHFRQLAAQELVVISSGSIAGTFETTNAAIGQIRLIRQCNGQQAHRAGQHFTRIQPQSPIWHHPCHITNAVGNHLVKSGRVEIRRNRYRSHSLQTLPGTDLLHERKRDQL